ncbi:MAG: DUF2232 domain-containing protein [Eubacterium sp.]
MKTKAMAEGAMFCALAVLLALICYYVPFLIVLYIFIPVPIVVLARKQGFKVSMISSVAATILLFLLVDPVTAVSFGMYLILVGCSLGYTYYKEKNGFIKLLIGYGSSFLVIILGIVLFQVISGQNYIDNMITMFATASTEALKIYENPGLLSGDQMAQMGTMIDSLMNTLKLSIPGAFLILPFFLGWANVVFSDIILKRLRMPVVPLKKLSQWQLPKSLKTFLIVVIVFVLAIDLMKIEAVPQIYTFTITSIISTIYFIMGLSFIFWLMARKKVKENMGLKILIVVLCVLFSFLMSIVTFVGVIDIYIDLRMLIEIKGGTKS